MWMCFFSGFYCWSILVSINTQCMQEIRPLAGRKKILLLPSLSLSVCPFMLYFFLHQWIWCFDLWRRERARGRRGPACVFDECLDRMLEIVGAQIRCVWRGTRAVRRGTVCVCVSLQRGGDCSTLHRCTSPHVLTGLYCTRQRHESGCQAFRDGEEKRSGTVVVDSISCKLVFAFAFSILSFFYDLCFFFVLHVSFWQRIAS